MTKAEARNRQIGDTIQVISYQSFVYNHLNLLSSFGLFGSKIMTSQSTLPSSFAPILDGATEDRRSHSPSTSTGP